jgi:hypothetical protein
LATVKGQHSVGKRRSPLAFLACLALVAATVLGVVGYEWAGSSGSHGLSAAELARLRLVLEREDSTPQQRLQAKLRGEVTAVVRAYLRGREGTIEVAIESLKSRHLWIIRSGPPAAEDDASIVKVDILETLLNRTPPATPPLSASLNALAESMIEYSDNDAATALWNDVGGKVGVARYNHRVGIRHTTTSFAWGLTTSMPVDQLSLLRNLVAPSHLLATVQRNYALNLMEHVAGYEDWGVSAGVPPNATVALKNGWLPNNQGIWQINSIGWVDGDRRDYLIAVMTTGNPTEDYGIATIEGVSKLVSPRMTRV